MTEEHARPAEASADQRREPATSQSGPTAETAPDPDLAWLSAQPAPRMTDPRLTGPGTGSTRAARLLRTQQSQANRASQPYAERVRG